MDIIKSKASLSSTKNLPLTQFLNPKLPLAQYKITIMAIHTLTPEQLHQWYTEKKDFILLDVREDSEVLLAALPDHIHIPMNMIPIRHNELPDDKPIILYCHHGMRSMQVALYLERVGFENLYNLTGGINAWSCKIDPTIPLY